MLCGVSFAQDLAPLKNLVGEKSTISAYGPYYHNGTKFWVAHIEPENQSYALSGAGLVKDAGLEKKVLAVHETRALASRRSGFWRYYAAPAKLAIEAGGLFFGFAERTLPIAFGTAKILFGVSEIFMPEPAARAGLASSVVQAPEPAATAGLGLVDGAEGFFVACAGLQKEKMGLYSAGWDARLALENVGLEKSYESVAEYSKKTGVVSSLFSKLAEKTQESYERTGVLADEAVGVLGATYPGFAGASSAKDFFRERGGESLEKSREYAREFSSVQLKNN